MNNAISTSDLFAATHSALCAHNYGQARALLDELSQRADNRDMLASARAYRVPEHVVSLFQDRIDLVNSKAA
jgi:hypothetical protein